ncbi:MAG: zinc ribbon-containing protein [Halofilum sp. (in: g-proteobacteria)]|nr:zinc ribbon-containing protein [Halofilum sp. (in: g-proteobacteria)]
MADEHDSEHDATSARLVRAYRHMLDRARELMEQETRPSLKGAVESARKTTVELGELTREEADQVSRYVRRDLHDAGEYLARTGRELREWAGIDLSMVEQGLLDLFVRAADRTRLEYEAFSRELQEGPIYRSGEMAGPGTLRCSNCGQLMHFHEPGHIPPCPRCHKTEFRRARREE